MTRPLSGPNDISQFVVKAEVVSQNEDLYYCDGRPRHPHARETTFFLISPKRNVEYVIVQCIECKALYTFSAEIPKIIQILL